MILVSIILFLIGLYCFLSTLGYIFKFLLGRWFDDDFVPEFVKKGLKISAGIAMTVIAVIFICITIGFVMSL